MKRSRMNLFLLVMLGLLALCGSVLAVEPNLVGWWKFDEGSGMDANDSAGSNHGVLVGEPNWTTGKIGGALQFDGVDDYVEIPNSNNLRLTNAITVAVWAKVDSFDVWRAMVSKGQWGGGHEYWLGYNPSNKTDFKFNYQQGENLDANTVITDSDWHHLAGVYDGSDIYVFVDGVLDSTPMSYVDINDNTGSVNIAYTKAWGYGWLDGFLDEVCIYNRPLTKDEIYDLYVDLDGDHFIGWGDVRIISKYWLGDPNTDPNVRGDLNNDDILNFLDFAKFGLAW